MLRLGGLRPRLNALVLLAAFLAPPALAAPDGNTLKLSFGAFDVYGTYTKGSCAAQAFLRSVRGQRLGFSLYWVPGRALYVMTKHPEYAATQGSQKVQFRFPDGEVVAFNMKRRGTQVQANIGFGARAQVFYDKIVTSPTLRIELVGVRDAVDLPLERRRELEAAMRHCRDWLKS